MNMEAILAIMNTTQAEVKRSLKRSFFTIFVHIFVLKQKTLCACSVINSQGLSRMVANKILMAIDFSILTACTRLDLFSRVLQECMSIGTVLDSFFFFFFFFNNSEKFSPQSTLPKILRGKYFMIVHDFSSGMTPMSLACWCSGFVLPLKNIHSRNGTNMGSLIERNTTMLVSRQQNHLTS